MGPAARYLNRPCSDKAGCRHGLKHSKADGLGVATDRCFLSLADTWRSSTSLPTDVKELIPQFYSSDPSFLLNAQGTHFGTRSSGQPKRSRLQGHPRSGQKLLAQTWQSIAKGGRVLQGCQAGWHLAPIAASRQLPWPPAQSEACVAVHFLCSHASVLSVAP